MEEIAKNAHKPVIEVKHTDCTPLSEGQIAVNCPECKKGTITVQRDPVSTKLLAFDRCLLCGQQFLFTDISDGTVPLF